jgi:hypothetical protein
VALGSAFLTVDALDVEMVALGMLMFAAIIGLLFGVPFVLIRGALNLHDRLARESDSRHTGRRGRVTSIEGMTRLGYVAIVLAGVWCAWSIPKLLTMTIYDITSMIDPAAGLDPIPDANLTLMQRDGAWAVLWLAVPVVAVIIVAVLRKRGVAVVVGSALVPIAMFTHVLGYEAIPAAGLLALAGFIGPRPSGVARQSNVVAAPPTLEPDV